MSAKYSWKWQGDARWSRSLVTVLRHRAGCPADVLWRRRVTRRRQDVRCLGSALVERALHNFIKCQCGALAVDMGLRSRASEMRVEQCCSVSLMAISCVLARGECSSRLARAMLLAATLGYMGPVAGAASALRLRSRRRGETPPVKLLESFLFAYLPRP
jgi:hypothetical protein